MRKTVTLGLLMLMAVTTWSQQSSRNGCNISPQESIHALVVFAGVIDPQSRNNKDGERTCMSHDSAPSTLVTGDLVTYHDDRVITYDEEWILNIFAYRDQEEYKTYQTTLRRIQAESVCTIAEQ